MGIYNINPHPPILQQRKYHSANESLTNVLYTKTKHMGHSLKKKKKTHESLIFFFKKK